MYQHAITSKHRKINGVCRALPANHTFLLIKIPIEKKYIYIYQFSITIR